MQIKIGYGMYRNNENDFISLMCDCSEETAVRLIPAFEAASAAFCMLELVNKNDPDKSKQTFIDQMQEVINKVESSQKKSFTGKRVQPDIRSYAKELMDVVADYNKGRASRQVDSEQYNIMKWRLKNAANQISQIADEMRDEARENRESRTKKKLR